MHVPIAVTHAPTFYMHALIAVAHAHTFYMHAPIAVASEYKLINACAIANDVLVYLKKK